MKGYFLYEFLLELLFFYCGYFSGLLFLNKKKIRFKFLISLLLNFVMVVIFCYVDLILKLDFKKRKMVNVLNYFFDNFLNKDFCGFKSFWIICIEVLKFRVKVRLRVIV